MSALEATLRTLIGTVEDQNTALRRGDLHRMERTTAKIVAAWLGVEAELSPGRVGEALPLVRRLAECLERNAVLIDAARSGVSNARRGASVGYAADGGAVLPPNDDHSIRYR